MNPNYVFVANRAGHICEYCRAPEAVFNLPFEVEHIIPNSRGGDDGESNLALSCRSCNLYKSNVISVFDEETQLETRLFNPRRDVWEENFAIDKETAEIKSLTPIGRITIRQLRMNGKIQLSARNSWIKLGLFK